MSVSEWLFIAVALASAAFIFRWWLKMRRVFSLARKIPGISGLPIIGNLLNIVFEYDCDPIKIMTKSDRYEGIARFWIGNSLVIAIFTPEYLQPFYTSNALIDRSEQYLDLEQALGVGSLVTSSGETWKKVRKMMVQSFHPMSQEVIVAAMISEAHNLISTLKTYADKGLFEFAPIIRKSGNCLITNVALDEKLEENKDVARVINYMEELLRISVLKMMSPLHFFNVTFNMTAEGRFFHKHIAELREVMKNFVLKKKRILKEMLESGKEPPNIYIYNLLQKYGDEEMELLISQVITTYATSVDTTTGTLGFIMHLLGIHPEWQESVLREDEDIQKRLGGRTMEPNDLQDYEVLERVIKESLRLYPVAPIIGRVAKEEVEIGKYTIPVGANVIAASMCISRKADQFTDPMKFNPDRFLSQNAAKVHPYAFTPFSAGPRVCTGMKFAMTFMKIIVSNMVRNFKIYSEFNTIDEIEQHLLVAITLKDKRNVRLRLENR